MSAITMRAGAVLPEAMNAEATARLARRMAAIMAWLGNVGWQIEDEVRAGEAVVADSRRAVEAPPGLDFLPFSSRDIHRDQIML